MPAALEQLYSIRETLEKHYRDMQDVEFTIEDGKLFMLQTRSGKRTAPAAFAHGRGHGRGGTDQSGRSLDASRPCSARPVAASAPGSQREV